MRNASLHVTCLLALLMTAGTAWSQSSSAVDQQLSPMGHRNPAEMMNQIREEGATAVKVPPVPTQVESPAGSSYTFSAVDFPGVSISEAFDTFNGVILGDFFDDTYFEATTGFTMKANVAQLYTIPGFTGVPALFAINTSGEMVGAIQVPQVGIRSVEIINGQATIFDPPQSALLDEAIGVNAHGTIVGIYFDSSNVSHGYIYKGGTFTTIDSPGAAGTAAYDINLAGEIVGCWTDTGYLNHGYALKNGTFTDIEFPQAMSTCANTIDDKGDIAGTYHDGSNVAHGFLYRNGVFQTIDVPRASGTFINRLKNSGELVGSYADDKGALHGFTAR